MRAFPKKFSFRFRTVHAVAVAVFFAGASALPKISRAAGDADFEIVDDVAAPGLTLPTAVSAPNAEVNDEMIILDDVTAAPSQGAVASPIAEEEISLGTDNGGGEEVSLDLGGNDDFFNPYVFDRSSGWLLLPVLSLILLGLHLLPVPKLKRKKLVPMTNFFRHAATPPERPKSGEERPS